MQVALLVYQDEKAWANLSAPEREAETQKFPAYVQELEQRGVRLAKTLLQPSAAAKTVHAQDGHPTNRIGPYPDGQDQLSAIYILNCKDMDEAIALAEKLPAAKFRSVEVRPIVGWRGS